MQRDRKKFSQIPAYSGLCDFVDNRERNIAAALQSELSKTLEATANAEKFMKVVRKYTSFEELDRFMLNELIDRITIYETPGMGRNRIGKEKTITIYYKFVGAIQ